MDEQLPQLIASVGGIVITLALAYVPQLKGRWEQLSGSQKRTALGLCYLAVSAGLYVPACFGGPQVVACNTGSIWDVATAFILALVSSQSVYTALPSGTKTRMSGD